MGLVHFLEKLEIGSEVFMKGGMEEGGVCYLFSGFVVVQKSSGEGGELLSMISSISRQFHSFSSLSPTPSLSLHRLITHDAFQELSLHLHHYLYLFISFLHNLCNQINKSF